MPENSEEIMDGLFFFLAQEETTKENMRRWQRQIKFAERTDGRRRLTARRIFNTLLRGGNGDPEKDRLRRSARFYVRDFDPLVATEARMVWQIGMMYYFLMRLDKSHSDTAWYLDMYKNNYLKDYRDKATKVYVYDPTIDYAFIQQETGVLHKTFFDGSIQTLEDMMDHLKDLNQKDLGSMVLTLDDFIHENDLEKENHSGNGGLLLCPDAEKVDLSIFKIVEQKGKLKLVGVENGEDTVWTRGKDLGKGIGGTVTLYEHPSSETRKVVLKQYNSQDDEEIALLKTFDDGGCPVIGIRLIEYDGFKFSLMQVARGDVFSIVAKTEAVARKVCYEMCRIYACMKRETGLLYGDIKLENMLYTCNPGTKSVSFFAGDIGGFRREGEKGSTTHPPPIPYDHVFVYDTATDTTVAYSRHRCWYAAQQGVHPEKAKPWVTTKATIDAFAATGDVLAWIDSTLVPLDRIKKAEEKESDVASKKLLQGGAQCVGFKKDGTKCQRQAGQYAMCSSHRDKVKQEPKPPAVKKEPAKKPKPKPKPSNDSDFVLKKETLETQWFMKEEQGILEEVDDEDEADFILHDVRGDGNCFHYALLRASKAKGRKPGVTRVKGDPRIETLIRKGKLIKPVLTKEEFTTYKNLFSNLFPLVDGCRAFQEPSFQEKLELAMIGSTREAFIQNLTTLKMYIQYLPGVHDVLFQCLFDVKIRVYWEHRGWVGVYADADPTEEDVVNLYYEPEHFRWLEPIAAAAEKKKPPAAEKKKPVHVGKKEFDKIDVMQYKELNPRTVLENPEKSLEKYDQWFASEKIDGWQAIWDGQGKLYTKTYIRTFSVPQYWLELLPKGVALAGEIKIQGEEATKTAALMKESELWEKTYFHVFDIVGVDGPFRERVEMIKETVNEACSNIKGCPLIAAPQRQLSWREILGFYKQVLNEDGEGLVLTDPDSLYDSSGKRSASRVKLKGRNDKEGTVIDHNVKDGKLRSLVVEMDNGIDFHLGIGFTNVERNEYSTKFSVGTRVTFSYRGFGEHGKPKEAHFVRVRRDLK